MRKRYRKIVSQNTSIHNSQSNTILSHQYLNKLLLYTYDQQKINMFTASDEQLIYQSSTKKDVFRTWLESKPLELPHQLKQKLTYLEIRQLLQEKDDLISRQAATITQLQQKLKNTIQNAKKMRQNQLFQIFKKKYENQVQIRTQLEKQLVSNISIISQKTQSIHKNITTHLSQELQLSLTDSLLSPTLSQKFSGNISQIFPAGGRIIKTIDIGQVTRHDVENMMGSLTAKMQFLDTIVEIMVLKFQKYSLEHKHMNTMIKVAKKELENQLQKCRNNLKQQISKNEKLTQQIQNIQSDKRRWRQGFKNLGSDGQKQRLLQFQKGKLVEQIIKLMYCLQSMEKKKHEKQKELQEFKKEEKKRYQDFLKQIKQYQK